MNKGWFLAKLTLKYQNQIGISKFEVEENQYLFLGANSITFNVPVSVNYESMNGVQLTADVVLGPQIFTERITQDPDCFHIWGSLFSPTWSRAECW